MSRVYYDPTAVIYKNIRQDSPIGLVFLSGLGTPISQQREAYFRRFALTSGISYLALDYTKYARQHKNSEDFQLPAVVSETATILEKCPEQKLVLFGACFGGLMSLLMTQKMPQKIAGAVVTSPLCELPSFPWAEKANQFLHHRVQEKTQQRQPTLSQLRRLAIFHQLLMAALRTVSKTPLTKNYHGPITIFHGQRDPLVPVENSFHLQKFLENPNLQLRIIPHMKHTIMLDADMKRPISILKQYISDIKHPV